LIFYLDDPTPTRLYTLSLHDALPIYLGREGPEFQQVLERQGVGAEAANRERRPVDRQRGDDRIESRAVGKPRVDHRRCFVDASSDRKSTRLNSSHVKISYAVFCLKKK